MDAEQLWETTMDPGRRTLLQVRLEDAAAANDLFSTLMRLNRPVPVVRSPATTTVSTVNVAPLIPSRS
ncbi:MAG: hypothetical protein ACLPJW_01415 [Rhodomicrobium sp.]